MRLKYATIVAAVNEITEQYTIKLTLRQIYYRLVARNLIPNTRSSYKTLSAMLVKAREDRKVKEERIEDRSRQVLGSQDWGYESPEQFLEELARSVRDSWKRYTKPFWDGQPERVAIVLEKDALSRLFLDAMDPYRLLLFPTRGYGSFTYIRSMASLLRFQVPTTVLYFGDFDPSGQDIERDLKERLIKYGARNIAEITRVAITPAQVKEYDLPPRPDDLETLAKLRRDSRTARYGMDYAVELDAIEPPVLQGLVRTEIARHIDQAIWDEQQAMIAEEREELRKKLEGFTL